MFSVFLLLFLGQSPLSKASIKRKIDVGTPKATTSRGTRGGVKYIDDDSNHEETREFEVEKKETKPSSRVSRTSSSRSTTRSPVGGTSTTPSPGRTKTTPTRAKGTGSRPGNTQQTTPTNNTKSKGMWTTSPKKSTPQPGPSPSASISGSGTTPSLSKAQSFLRYKNRAGPRAPGSKEIPEGIITLKS